MFSRWYTLFFSRCYYGFHGLSLRHIMYLLFILYLGYTGLVIDTLSSAIVALKRQAILDRRVFLYDGPHDSETDWLWNRRCSFDHVMQAKVNFRSDEELTPERSAFQIFLSVVIQPNFNVNICRILCVFCFALSERIDIETRFTWSNIISAGREKRKRNNDDRQGMKPSANKFRRLKTFQTRGTIKDI